MQIKNVKLKPDQAAAKTGKSATNSLMDDAPLFAGLDDFVLLPSPRILESAPEKVIITEKKRKNPQPARQGRTSRQKPSRQSPDTITKPVTSPTNGALLLSVAEICRLLKISRATLIRMDKAGKIPGKIKLGGSVRFHRETVEAWLQSLLAPPLITP